MDTASPVVIPRGDPSATGTAAPQGPQHTNTSFFTFLIALLILVFASVALVLRAILIRRRYRRRVQQAVQQAIDAGILPNAPTIQHKPELYEVCARAAGDDKDWHAIMPICATNVRMPEHIGGNSKPKPIALNRSIRERLQEWLGRHSAAPSPAPAPDTSAHDTNSDEPSTVQVAVLIAMPSEHSGIPLSDPALRPDSSTNVIDEAVPDVLFGISTFAVISDETDP